MNRTLARIALGEVKRLRVIQANYDAECASYAAEGYRPHYCIHGTNQWTDYDNICGPCEDGYGSYSGAALYEVALMRAHAVNDRLTSRTDRIVPLISDTAMPAELRTRLIEWAFEPLQPYADVA